MPLIKRPPKSAALPVDERKVDRDFSSLAAQLDHPNAISRRWAARDLAASPQAVPVLLARLGIEADASVRAIIFSSLILLDGEEAMEGLITFLRSEEPALRNGAIEALKQLPDAIAPMMQHLLADPDADTRIFAVNILESLCHADVEHWLIEVIRTDAHVNVCASALEILSEVGTAAAQSALQQVKQRFAAEPYIQFAADLALKRIAQG